MQGSAGVIRSDEEKNKVKIVFAQQYFLKMGNANTSESVLCYFLNMATTKSFDL